MKLFSLLPLFTAGQMDFSNMSADQVGPMMETFLPMFKQFYNKMDHEQSMADFKKDDNGMFKKYFDFCDEGADGLLTKADDSTCKQRMQQLMMDMIDAMGEEMFNEIIDENHDGAATLAEIEMGGMDFDSMLAQADLSAVKQYVPDIEKLIKKAKRIIKKADLDHDKAYDDRELAKVMLDMMNMMIKRIFN